MTYQFPQNGGFGLLLFLVLLLSFLAFLLLLFLVLLKSGELLLRFEAEELADTVSTRLLAALNDHIVWDFGNNFLF